MPQQIASRIGVGLAALLLAASGLASCGGDQPARPAGVTATTAAGTAAASPRGRSRWRTPSAAR